MQMEKKSIVKRKSRDVELIRIGRGYSLSELKEAGLANIAIARARQIPIDVLRKTTHAENVEQLKPIVNQVLDSRTKSEKASRKTKDKEKSKS
jgi:ribosomal protein L13E